MGKMLNFDDGLVPLAIAARFAYEKLTPAGERIESEEELAEVMPLVALSLAGVAPILYRASYDAAPVQVHATDMQGLLYTHGADGAPRLPTGYFLRRRELYSAIDALKASVSLVPLHKACPP